MKDQNLEFKNLIMKMRQQSSHSEPEKGFTASLKSKLDKQLTKEDRKSAWGTFATRLYAQKLFISVVFCLIVGTFFVTRSNPITPTGRDETNLIDDWALNQDQVSTDMSSAGAVYKKFSLANPAAESMVGFSTGGAKDINNFRENIKNGYLPLLTDITHEGLYYDYYFDTNKTGDANSLCSKLFCPQYNLAVTKDPLSGKTEYYMAVGLKSGIKESDFARKKLNLVVVLDISGSMGSSFNSYYYDSVSATKTVSEDDRKAKIEIAKESIIGIIDQLKADDRFSLVVFDDQAYLAKPMTRIGSTDVVKLKEHIRQIQPDGGTNMDAGIAVGTEALREYANSDSNEYETRMIFLTDAMPNSGDTSERSFQNVFKSNAEKKIYTTFIGIGVDFNTALIESISKVKGANYYSVHSSSEFKKRLVDEFEYMVTPMVFNLKLALSSSDFKIDRVYGSPEADLATGQLMFVNTLFPSKTDGNGTKGGVVLVKLSKIGEGEKIDLQVSYDARDSKSDGSKASVTLASNIKPDFFETSGIEKAVLLSRYTNLMQKWLESEYDKRGFDYKPVPYDFAREGIPYDVMIKMPEYYKTWERQSVKLEVPTEYKATFTEFKKYMKIEMVKVNDNTLQKEIDLLSSLIK